MKVPRKFGVRHIELIKQVPDPYSKIAIIAPIQGDSPMKIRLYGSIAIAVVVVACACTAPLSAQEIPRLPNGKPDFSGIWDHPRVQDITRDSQACGGGTRGCSQKGTGDLPFTAEGTKRW